MISDFWIKGITVITNPRTFAVKLINLSTCIH